jgi:hypothetical protein
MPDDLPVRETATTAGGFSCADCFRISSALSVRGKCPNCGSSAVSIVQGCNPQNEFLPALVRCQRAKDERLNKRKL